MTVNGIAYTFPDCPKWVTYQVNLLTGRYGTNLDTGACQAIRHNGLLLARRYGV